MPVGVYIQRLIDNKTLKSVDKCTMIVKLMDNQL